MTDLTRQTFVISAWRKRRERCGSWTKAEMREAINRLYPNLSNEDKKKIFEGASK